MHQRLVRDYVNGFINTCFHLFLKVKAIYKYHFVYKGILPLREDLDKATKSLKDATDELNKKRAFLEECEKKCKELNDYFQETNLAK